MKKVVALLIMLALLSACGNQTDIRENMLNDTNQVIDIIEEIASTDREEKAEETELLSQYKAKYKDNAEMSHNEKMVQSMTMNLMNLHNNKAVIESANEIALEEVSEIRDYIKTGEAKR
jgi:uncharacterized protein YxeA